MEEYEEIRSRPSPVNSRSPDPSSPSVGQTTQMTVASTVPPRSPPASSSPQNASAVVLSSQAAAGGGGNSTSRRGGGGGREDCWSEGATTVLIDAWGERFLELSRGNLKQEHWKEVAEIVSSRDEYGKSSKTDIQCKNRIDTVKKKYKQEKARIAAGGGSSRWIFFDKLDRLIGATAMFPGGADGLTSQKVPMGISSSSRSNMYQRETPPPPRRSLESTRWRFRKRSASETESESEPELSADSAESLPPPPPPPPPRKRVKIEKTECGGGGGGGFGELARAVSRFSEAYEEAEAAKLKQMVEMEKERMKFMKELELQRMEFFVKIRMEISQLKQHKRRNNG